VLAFTGLPHAQIARLQPSHVDWNDCSVLVQGRKKGKGSRTITAHSARVGRVARVL